MEDKGGVWSIFNIGQKNPARHVSGSKRKTPNEKADGKGPAASEPADKKQKVGPAKPATVDAAAPKQKKQHKEVQQEVAFRILQADLCAGYRARTCTGTLFAVLLVHF